MAILEQLAAAFVATMTFSMIFQTPKRSLIQCGFVGMVSWIVYFEMVAWDFDPVPATLVASVFVGVTSQFFAKYYKTPVIIYNVAGIIPLVPGGMAYDVMRKFVENDYTTATNLAAKTSLIAGAIAIGLIFSEVMNQAIRRSRLGAGVKR